MIYSLGIAKKEPKGSHERCKIPKSRYLAGPGSSFWCHFCARHQVVNLVTDWRHQGAEPRQISGRNLDRMSARCLPDVCRTLVPFWYHFGVTFLHRDGTSVTFWRPGVVRGLQKETARRREEVKRRYEVKTKEDGEENSHDV